MWKERAHVRERARARNGLKHTLPSMPVWALLGRLRVASDVQRRSAAQAQRRQTQSSRECCCQMLVWVNSIGGKA